MQVATVRTYHKIEFSGLEYVVEIGIVEFEKIGSNGKRDIATLTSLQIKALEAFQFFDGTTDACDAIVNIKLYDFGGFAFPCIGEGDGGCE